MMTRALLVGLVLAGGCSKAAPGPEADAGAATVGGADAGAEVDGGAGGAIAPRRPKRRHYFARASERCEIYTIEGDAPSPPVEVPCPSDAFLARGERIRLVGKTCMRESAADPSREVPVICPTPLIELDRDTLEGRDAGP